LQSGALLAVFSLVVLLAPSAARAQFVNQQVGGVAIDARGVVTKVQVDDVDALLAARKAAFQPVPDNMRAAALRKISLRKLVAALGENQKNGAPISDEMRYLAGLQRIQYVFIYPDEQDIVLAGPGEGWRISPDGTIVGQSTNRPVLLLDDLLVALRAADALRQTGISCSIDPTPQGVAAYAKIMQSLARAPEDPRPLAAAVENAMGQQTITIKGVPDSSHFARVLIAADYRMKRLAMAFDKPPIEGLPDFLSMMRVARGGAHTITPRWWLSPDYDAPFTDGKGLAWEFRRSGVKAETEDRMLAASGQLQDSKHKDPLAQKWADNMTAHYEELAAADPIFGQLRNCMDLAVLSALISHHRLAETSGLDMKLLFDPALPVEMYHAPRSVDTVASVLEKRGGVVISASGGVMINPWPALEAAQESPALANKREQAASPAAAWWWD
jgi:hypothetical protein